MKRSALLALLLLSLACPEQVVVRDVPSECGNNEVEADEECDDGNKEASDDCTDGCLLARCGDGDLGYSGGAPSETPHGS